MLAIFIDSEGEQIKTMDIQNNSEFYMTLNQIYAVADECEATIVQVFEPIDNNGSFRVYQFAYPISSIKQIGCENCQE